MHCTVDIRKLISVHSNGSFITKMLLADKGTFIVIYLPLISTPQLLAWMEKVAFFSSELM